MTPAVTIPQLQKHLTLVQECFKWSNCIIAGGAVRDVLNGKPVKDIDVFIDLCEDPTAAALLLAERLYCTPKDFIWDNATGYGTMHSGYKSTPGTGKGAFLVCDLPKGIGSCPTQLIFLADDPVKNIHDTFDFDISQAWVTRYKVWTTPACRAAMVNKRITYCPREKPNAQQRASSRDRLERLKVKYAGWAFSGIITRDYS